MTHKVSLQNESVRTSWSISNLFDVQDQKPNITQTDGVAFVEFTPSAAESKSKAVSIDDYLSQLGESDEIKKLLSDGAKWVGDNYHQNSKSIKALRLRCGLSQDQLATKIGSTQNRISRIEKGDEDIRLSTMRKLANALDVTLQDIDIALGGSND